MGKCSRILFIRIQLKMSKLCQLLICICLLSSIVESKEIGWKKKISEIHKTVKALKSMAVARTLTVTSNVTLDWGDCLVVFEGFDGSTGRDCGPTGKNVEPGRTVQFEVENRCTLQASGETYFTRAQCYFKNTQANEKCVVPTTTNLNNKNNYEIKILGAPQSVCHLVAKN